MEEIGSVDGSPVDTPTAPVAQPAETPVAPPAETNKVLDSDDLAHLKGDSVALPNQGWEETDRP